MPRIRAATIEEHKRLTRSEILDAAEVLFSAHGYTETGLGDISSYVGIGRTTLYEYFSDKEDVLVNLVESRIPKVVESLLAGVPEAVGARERLGELIVRGLEFVSHDGDLGTILMRELPKLSEGAQARVRKAHRALEQAILDVCRDGIARGEFAAFDPSEAGRLVFAVVMAASQTLLGDDDAKQRIHEVADTLVHFVLDGLSG